MDILGTVTNLCNYSIFTVCPFCALRHLYGGKRILRRSHRNILCENGIGSHDTILLHYEKCTNINNSVIIDNDKNNLRIFHGSSSTDGERYDPVYAFSTKAKEIKSLGTSGNLKLIPEMNS